METDRVRTLECLHRRARRALPLASCDPSSKRRRGSNLKSFHPSANGQRTFALLTSLLNIQLKALRVCRSKPSLQLRLHVKKECRTLLVRNSLVRSFIPKGMSNKILFSLFRQLFSPSGQTFSLDPPVRAGLERSGRGRRRPPARCARLQRSPSSESPFQGWKSMF